MSYDRLPPMKVVADIDIDRITVEAGRREVREEEVARLAESMAKISLKTPITIRRTASGYNVVTGAHRLAAAKKLGWTKIACFVSDQFETDDQARLWEIAENLHRTELTALERSEQIAEWIKLTAPIASHPPKPVALTPHPVGKPRDIEEMRKIMAVAH